MKHTSGSQPGQTIPILDPLQTIVLDQRAIRLRAASPVPLAILSLALLALGIWLRAVAIGRGGFWGDEMFSASFANLSMLGTLIAVFVKDVHPPLYYLQLNLWGRLGHGDVWLLLNSVVWSAGTLIGVRYGTRHQYGSWPGVLALAFCAVMGSEVYFAHELRMYATSSCMVVLGWIAAERLHADYRFRSATPLIVLLAMLGAIHSASVIPVSAVLLYAFPKRGLRPVRERLPTWIGIVATVGCTLLPWVLNVSSRSVAHTEQASLRALIDTTSGWILGYGEVALPPWLAPSVAAAMAVLLVFAVVLVPKLARLVLCFIVWPLAFGAALCVLVQPIWLERTFAGCAPFLAVACGVGAWQLTRTVAVRLPAGLAFSLAAALALTALLGPMAWLAYLQAATSSKPDHYDELALYLQRHARSGDAIYAPSEVDFWGVARYLIGPDWGSILRYQDPEQLQQLKRWRIIYRYFGPTRLKQWGLMPESRRLDGFRAPLFTGSSPLPQLSRMQGVWLVGTNPAAVVPNCSLPKAAPAAFGRVLLYYLRCGGST